MSLDCNAYHANNGAHQSFDFLFYPKSRNGGMKALFRLAPRLWYVKIKVFAFHGEIKLLKRCYCYAMLQCFYRLAFYIFLNERIIFMQKSSATRWPIKLTVTFIGCAASVEIKIYSSLLCLHITMG